MKKIILFLALTYCFAQPADATKYHISIAGLIGNSGTSPSASWPESKVSTYPFLPSDSVVIRRGDLLSGTINFDVEVRYYNKSGAKLNYVTAQIPGTVFAKWTALITKLDTYITTHLNRINKL